MPPEISTSFDLPFEEQLAFFNKKKVVLSPDSWKDVWDKAHAKAFTVARVTSTDVLQEIQDKLKDAMEKGTTLKDFKEELVPYLENRGWYAPEGEKAVDLSGRKRLAGHRLTTIYRTNLASSYNTGRFKQQMDNRARRPFLQYHITPRPTNRPPHKAMDKFVAKVGSAVWEKWYPPNGFRCGCYVTALTAAQVKARGLDVSTKAPKIEPDDGSTPEEVKPDEGFDYHVGKAGLNVIQPNYRKYDKKLRDQLKGDLASLKDDKRAAVDAETAEDVRQKMLKAGEGFDKLKSELSDAAWKVKIADRRLTQYYIDHSHKTPDEVIKSNIYNRKLNELAEAKKIYKETLYEVRKARNDIHKVLSYDKKANNIVNTKRLDAGRRRAVKDAVELLNDWMGWDIRTIAFRTRKRRSYNLYGDIHLAKVSTSRRSAIHELGHTLEDRNPDAFKSAAEFLKRRTKGQTPIDITPPKKKLKEWAKEGGFFNRYCGRLYEDADGKTEATEIVSMGLQELADNPVKFANTDPDYFNFMINILRGNFKEAK